MKDESTIMDNPTPLALDVWNSLRELIAREKIPALSIDKFIVQRDAFVRLSEEGGGLDAPFVTYEHPVTSDSDFPFSLAMFADGFTIEIGPVSFSDDYVESGYGSDELRKVTDRDSLTPKPKRSAANILLLLKLLLNGQIALGLNTTKRGVMVTEVFLLGAGPRPLPILFHAHYRTFTRRATDYFVEQNRVIDDHYDIPESFMLLPPIVEGERVRRGRDVETIEGLAPLSRAEAESVKNEWIFRESLGKNSKDAPMIHIYKTSVFWMISLAYIAVALTLLSLPTTAAFFRMPIGYVVLLLGGRWGITYSVGYLLAKRQLRINRGELPISYRIERIFKRER